MVMEFAHPGDYCRLPRRRQASRNGPTRCPAEHAASTGDAAHDLSDCRAAAPNLRGRLTADAPLAPLHLVPRRRAGRGAVLAGRRRRPRLSFVAIAGRDPGDVVGLGSNLIVRDGGVRGVVIRLGGRAFGAIETVGDHRVVAGAAALDAQVARAAAEAGIDGLAFLRGVPGSIGGALRMNAGAHGGETRETLLEARGVDRSGAARVFTNAEMGFSYRHCGAPDEVIFTRASFQGRPGDPAAIKAEMERITARPGSLAADSRKDRRLDIQEPAWREGLAADRRRGLSRARRRRRARSRGCTATS